MFTLKGIPKPQIKLISFLILSVVLSLFSGGCSKGKNLPERISQIDNTVEKTIAAFGIRHSDLSEEEYQIKKSGNITYTYIKKSYRNDKIVDLKKLLKKLNENLNKDKAAVVKSKFTYLANRNLANFVIKTEGLKVYTLNLRVFPEKAIPKIAIVLDDWGYNLNNLSSVLDIESPLTFSVIPDLAYSTTISKVATEHNQEVIIHLPMEPKNKIPIEKEVIKVGMDNSQVARILKHAIKSIPDAKGLSNHMGSKATEDERILTILFKQMKKYNLYFLDSFVTSKTKSEEAARKVGMRLAKRSVFIDNQNNFDYINKQMQELAKIARAKGRAIGIGHDRKSTISALKKIMPELEKENVDFVHLSELVRPLRNAK